MVVFGVPRFFRSNFWSKWADQVLVISKPAADFRPDTVDAAAVVVEIVENACPVEAHLFLKFFLSFDWHATDFLFDGLEFFFRDWYGPTAKPFAGFTR